MVHDVHTKIITEYINKPSVIKLSSYLLHIEDLK